MRGRGLWWGGVLAAVLPVAAAAGQTPAPAKAAPCADAKVVKPCMVPGREPGVLEQFPYPGEVKAGEVKAGEVKAGEVKGAGQAQGQVPDAPKAAGDGSGKAVGDQFPYPGEVPRAGDAPQGEGSSSSSSGAGGIGGVPGETAGDAPGSTPADAAGNGEGKPKIKDEGSEGSTPRTRRRLRPQAQKILSDDERVDEDLSVSEFYRKNGNLNGAYQRAKDAVKLQPDLSDAHLAVAEAAEKLGKKDEAAVEYRTYLRLDPAGDGAKAAQKALGKLDR